MKWGSLKFGDLYSEKTRNGVYKSAEHHGHGIKIVNMGELFANGFIGPQSMERVELSEKEMQTSLLLENDLLFARRSLVESGAGKASIVRGLCETTTFESSVIRVRLNPDICVPMFYYYWFKSHRGRGAIQPLVTGVNVKGIRGSELLDMKVDYPPLQTQKRIASFLYAYDSLIEKNMLQIKLLEEAAQRLYKEWFIDLCFPGHETTPIHDGLPEGWGRCAVTDLLEIKYGKDHKALSDGTIPVYGSGGIMRRVDRVLNSGESVLIPRKGSLNNILYVTGDFWTIDTMFYSIPKEPNVAKYMYLFLSRLDMYSFNIGAAVPSMTVKILDGVNVLLPPAEMLTMFERTICPFFERIIILEQQNETAAQARDRLLPKLMSGEIEV